MPSKTDELISQGMGKAKVMKGAIKGLGGVFRTLMEQHGKASGLLHRIKAADDVEKRTELWDTVRAQLLAHERSEMEVIYRELHYDPRTREMAEHHDQEAGELERLIRQLDASSIGDSQWMTLFDQLVDTVQHHVSEEEGEIFPRAQDVLGKERVKALDATFEDAFDAQLRMA
jgi:hemerythrin superfamily protein